MSGIAEYDDFDVVEMARLLRAGELQAAELVEEAIARIESENPALNAVVHTDFGRARAWAGRERDDAAPLAGIPFLLKDLNAADRGQPMGKGSRFTQQYRPDYDDELVRRYHASGLITLGRTNTPEFGIKGTTEPTVHGPTRNPWDLERIAGGSSGGSAVAVAARWVPVAHGGDGGGSIRIPASACGLVGLKPTRGRTPAGPRRGEAGWQGMVVEHALTRSVRDTATLLDLTQGPDVGSPYEIPPPARPYVDELSEAASATAPLRIAWTGEPLFAGTTHPVCKKALMEAVELAQELGHRVEERRPEFDRGGLVQAYFRLVAAGIARTVQESASDMGRWPRWNELEPATWFLARLGEVTRAVDQAESVACVHGEGRRLGAFFEDWDVLLTPTLAQPPSLIGALDQTAGDALLIRLLCKLGSASVLTKAIDQMAEANLAATPNTQLFNLSGQPAISLPLHWTPEGLPIGTQWAGRWGDESTLIRLAAQLERARPWRDRRPPRPNSAP